MKFAISVLITLCLVKASTAYSCHECNSTTSDSCFDLTVKNFEFNVAFCDVIGLNDERCYTVQFTDKGVRQIHRGCKENNICDVFERQYNVVVCAECTGRYCNSTDAGNSLITSVTLFITMLSLAVTSMLR